MLTANYNRQRRREDGTGAEKQHHVERNAVRIDTRFYSVIRRWFASLGYGNVLESSEVGLGA